jgi:pseudouridine-5'-phosphate glycosidase
MRSLLINQVVMRQFLDCSGVVLEALASGGAVVALESAIITHGMPYPRNVETALRVEAAVRAGGALPATCAVVGGRLRVGLNVDELEYLGRPGRLVEKVSRRDLAAVVSGGADGGTTVAATMLVAALAGVEVFATGGIGGVHRGGESSMDISADLVELARTPVAVVCSGAKSILDIGRTLEYLETHGVPVVGFGTDYFPAFYAPSSGLRVDRRVDTVEELARIWSIQRSLGSGMIIGNPVSEEVGMDSGAVSDMVSRLVLEAEVAGIRGKLLTPWLLGRMEEISGGRSLWVNEALVEGNAGVAARLSVALKK